MGCLLHRILASALLLTSTQACALVVDFEGYRAADGGAAPSSGAGGAPADGGGGAAGGEPISCEAPSDCPTFAADGPCQTTSCVLGICNVDRAAPGTPVGAQRPGDCSLVGCGDAGTLTTLPDPADAFDDNNECTVDGCSGTTPVHMPASPGTPCGSGLACNASGQCSGCTADAQCPADTPCTDHGCNRGTTLCEQTAAADGTPCPDGGFCNGAETCQSGNCVSPGNPCPGPDGDDDCSEGCNEGTDTCDAADADGSVCNDGAYCNGADNCSGGVCATHAGNPCSGADGDADCSETCDESVNACSGNDPDGSACNDGLFCSGTDTCLAGSCSQHTNVPCPPGPPDSDCNDGCNESTQLCDAPTDGAVCKIGNDFGDCQGGACILD
jgi:hypothetical protein